jgi:hypothetical protein
MFHTIAKVCVLTNETIFQGHKIQPPVRKTASKPRSDDLFLALAFESEIERHMGNNCPDWILKLSGNSVRSRIS